MKLFKYLIISSIVLFASCQRTITERIMSNVQSGDTIIDIVNYADFPWDSVVIFSRDVNSQDIDERFADLEDLEVGDFPIIFYYKGKIVDYEIEGSSKNLGYFKHVGLVHLEKGQALGFQDELGVFAVQRKKSRLRAKIDDEFKDNQFVLLYDE